MRTALPLDSLALALAFACVLASPARADDDPPAAVDHADADRFMGRWYEIARLPNDHESDCARDVVSTYERRNPSTIRVTYTCRDTGGAEVEVRGVARIRDTSQAKLELRFAPLALAWLPFVWDDWWILEVAPGYEYMMAGDPARHSLWIYARASTLDDTTYRTLVAHAAAQGYDTAHLVRTRQSSP
jgi:apolipoprotein D and lipocalin family protein